MREVTITKKIYKFDELPEKTRNIVINNYISYLLDFDEWGVDSFVSKAIKKANQMQVPWAVGSYVYEYGKENILRDVREEEYFSNGKVYIDF